MLYLLKLGIGWAIGMLLAVVILSSLFDSQIYIVSSLFIGFIAGAIPAMFLPGISGSTLLLIFGAYIPVITAVRGIIGLDFSYLPAILCFGLGIIVGAVTVVKGIKICLEKFRVQSLYAILGMMIGSFYAIIQGPATLDLPKEAMNFSNFNFIACVIGLLLVIEMYKIKERSKKNGI